MSIHSCTCTTLWRWQIPENTYGWKSTSPSCRWLVMLYVLWTSSIFKFCWVSLSIHQTFRNTIPKVDRHENQKTWTSHNCKSHFVNVRTRLTASSCVYWANFEAFARTHILTKYLKSPKSNYIISKHAFPLGHNFQRVTQLLCTFPNKPRKKAHFSPEL